MLPPVADKYKNNVPGYIGVLLRPPNLDDTLTPMYPVYPEYSSVTLPGLLAQGQKLTTDTTEARAFEKSVNALLTARTQFHSFPVPITLFDNVMAFVKTTSLDAFSPHLPSAAVNIRIVPR